MDILNALTAEVKHQTGQSGHGFAGLAQFWQHLERQKLEIPG
jgi:hypothetical protein